MKQKDPDAPFQLHGASISYFTGKLEDYMHYEESPRELVDGYDLGKIFYTEIKKMLLSKRRRASGSITRRRQFNGFKRSIPTPRLRRKIMR